MAEIAFYSDCLMFCDSENFPITVRRFIKKFFGIVTVGTNCLFFMADVIDANEEFDLKFDCDVDESVRVDVEDAGALWFDFR